MADRREFFASIGGVFRKEGGQKEPYAPPPPFFDPQKADICKECETSPCVSSCEEGIIKKEGGKPPVLDFSNRGCSFCPSCAFSCEKGVFAIDNSAKINALVEIDPLKCLAYNGVICKSCFDPCHERAIDFSGLFYPIINAEKCSACGFCIGVCPTKAIIVKRG